MRKPKSYIKHPDFKNPDVLLCLARASRIFTTFLSSLSVFGSPQTYVRPLAIQNRDLKLEHDQ